MLFIYQINESKLSSDGCILIKLLHIYRLQELRAEINETKQARSQLEQVTYALSDELRSLRNKVEGQQAEFVNMVSDVRNRARKLEDESRIHVRYEPPRGKTNNVTRHKPACTVTEDG